MAPNLMFHLPEAMLQKSLCMTQRWFWPNLLFSTIPWKKQSSMPETHGKREPRRNRHTLGGPPCTWQSRRRNDKHVQRTNGYSNIVAYYRWVSLFFILQESFLNNFGSRHVGKMFNNLNDYCPRGFCAHHMFGRTCLSRCGSF